MILDLEITPELKAEGQVREFIRQVQDLRKQSGLSPCDRARLFLSFSHPDRALIEAERVEISRAVGVTDIRWDESGMVSPRLERV